MLHSNLRLPATASHPGKLLGEELAHRKISQRTFAQMIGKTPNEVHAVIKGIRDINPDFAMRLFMVFGVSAEVWLNLQNIYDLVELRKLKEKKSTYAQIKKNVKRMAPSWIAA